jgi:hypothetical protein
MNRPLTGNEPHLVGYWTFDEGEGQTAHDLTANGLHGILGASLDPGDDDPRWGVSDAPMILAPTPMVTPILTPTPLPPGSLWIFR